MPLRWNRALARIDAAIPAQISARPERVGAEVLGVNANPRVPTSVAGSAASSAGACYDELQPVPKPTP